MIRTRKTTISIWKDYNTTHMALVQMHRKPLSASYREKVLRVILAVKHGDCEEIAGVLSIRRLLQLRQETP
jgi:hypothetical protein